LRTITASRRVRSPRLLVGSIAGSCRNSSTLPRSCCRPIPSSSRWLSWSCSLRGLPASIRVIGPKRRSGRSLS
jgi:hypothetical protein